MNIKKLTLILVIACSAVFSQSSQAGIIGNTFTIELVADNDFAIFSGTSTSINALMYQNNVVWNQQIAQLQTQTFTLGAGNDTFYVLAMGGGGAESLSGEVNGVNIVDASASMSDNIAIFLSGYNNTSVENGSYNVQLGDVQNSLNGLSWGAPMVSTNQIVINESNFGRGFTFEDSSAHLFRFNASDVNVQSESVPEPSLLSLMALGLLGLTARARKNNKKA
jgi:hypothetical protein